QLREFLRGLELGIIFGHGKQAFKRAGQLILGGSLVGRARGLHGHGAEFGDVLERTFFVGGVAFHSFDQIWNQVVAAFELNVDVGPGRFGAHAQLYQAVVHPDQEDAEQNYDCQNNPGHADSPRCGFKGTLTQKGQVSKFQIATTRSNLETLKPCDLALLSWSVVSAAGAGLEVFFHGSNLDGAVASVGIEVGGFVGNVVLAAQLVFNGGEGVRDVLHLVGEEGAAAGGGGEVFENFVAAQDQAAVVGRDGIDENFGALCHFNGLGARVFALIVFAVAQDDDGFANGMLGMFAQQLFLAGFVDCVIQRGAAAIAEALHAGREQRHFVGEILGKAALFVEPYDEGAVIAGTNDVLQKS